VTAGARGIFFDVDGTLVDTAYIHTVTWWQALRRHGHDVPMALIHRSIGMGGDQLLDHVLPERDRSGDEAMKDVRVEYYKQYWDDLRPLPGARELVRECHRRGLRVVLASSAKPPELEALRRALDVDDALDDATGAGDADAAKPNPDILQVALSKVDIPPQSAVFVGDAVWDAVVARKVDVPFIGVESGGTSAAELRENGAVAVFKNPAELLEHLDGSPLAQLLRQ
jgi:HAD superfamily hydrolase (TIGR01549 family)